MLFTPSPRPADACQVDFIGRSKGGKAVATQFPMWDKGAPVYYWADKGLVRWEDTREGLPPHQRYGFMYWQVAAKRILALSEMVTNSRGQWQWEDERRKIQQFITDMEGVIRTAKEQGGPFDGDAVLREYKRRRPVSVVVPQVVDLD